MLDSMGIPLPSATDGRPTRLENSVSSASRLGPMVESQLVANASATYFISVPPMWGMESRMRLGAFADGVKVIIRTN